MRLFVDLGSPQALKIALVNRFTESKIEVVEIDTNSKESRSNEQFVKVSPSGKLPALEIDPSASIVDANAISRFLANKQKGTPLVGPAGSRQAALVDQWLEWESNSLFPATKLHYFAISVEDQSEALESRSLAQVSALEASLKGKCLIGDSITVADLVLWATLFPALAQDGFFVREQKTRFPKVCAWFDALAADATVKQVLSATGISAESIMNNIYQRAQIEYHPEKKTYALCPRPDKTMMVTTPIYYVNGEPHIGHVYTTLIADVVARWSRLRGFDTFFMTGTDEHGQKVAQSAEKKGISPKEFCDGVSALFRKMFDFMNCSYDYYIRTTDADHEVSVVAMWNKLWDAGHIYMGYHEGWYCVSDEAFYTELQVQDGVDKDGKPCKVSKESGQPVEWIREPNLKFRLSAFQDKLLEFYESHPDAIVPRFRQKEIMQFIRGGLNDLSVSRTKMTCTWGIPVPGHPEHVMYVWLDALTNYLTAAGHPSTHISSTRWPADYHLVGKDILRFHAVYWPAFLMGAGIPLPKTIVAHGWWTKDGRKISKSLGNAFDPVDTVTTFGLDAFRYFLMRESNMHSDGDYTDALMTKRLNSDLADDLGNLVLRCVSEKINPDQKIPQIGETTEADRALIQQVSDLPGWVDHHIFASNIQQALVGTWQVIQEINKYVSANEPWKLVKSDPARLNTVLYVMIEAMRIVALVVSPVMPQTSPKILDQLGVPAELRTGDALKFGLLQAGTPLGTSREILFQKKRDEVPAPVAKTASSKPEKPKKK